MPKLSNTGLAGQVIAQSKIAEVSSEHESLAYCGYNITELCEQASFEEVSYLLIYGELPSKQQYQNFCEQLVLARQLPEPIMSLLQLVPKTASPMDVLRSTVSMLGCLQPETEQTQLTDIATHTMGLLPAALLYWYRFHRQLPLDVLSKPEASTAVYFLQSLQGKTCSADASKALNTSLISYAEHDFNASTFAARVTTSTLSDYYSAICSAIGTLKGPLHGGANEKALELIQKFSDPAQVASKLKAMLDNKEKIMGFGHRVYRSGDPRSPIAQAWAEKLSCGHPEQPLYKISTLIEKIMWEEKHIPPNLDFYTATMYHYCGIPIELFTPLFVLSRITGWSAHIIEQRENNKLIRPLAEYIGPKNRKYLAWDKRESNTVTE